MQTYNSYYTPTDDDSIPCPNDCKDGYVYEQVYNHDTEQWESEKHICKVCEGVGNINKRDL